ELAFEWRPIGIDRPDKSRCRTLTGRDRRSPADSQNGTLISTALLSCSPRRIRPVANRAIQLQTLTLVTLSEAEERDISHSFKGEGHLVMSSDSRDISDHSPSLAESLLTKT